MSKEVRSLPDDPGKLKRLLWRERQQHQQLVDQHQRTLARHREVVQQHQRTLAQHQEVVRQYEETVQGQQTTISQQEHRIAQLLRRLYGPKQERIDPNQLTLFDGDDLEALTAESPEEAPGEEEKARKQRRGRGVGHGRRRLPKHLPRETVLHELSEEARRCPCCGELREEIGRETSEQLEYVPAQVKVLVHQRVKYACRRCQEQVVIAAKPPQPIAKGLPGPGLLAQTVLGKYGDHLPLYRLEDILARQGVTIRRSTLCGWIAAAADLGEPLYRRMCQRVLQSKVLHTDDTAVKLLDPLLGRAREARFWAYIGDRRHPYAVYDFTPHHQRDGPAKFLGGFEGYLQADAYGGYDGIFLDSGGKIVEVACWAHCRRYWWEAKTTDSPRAHQALSYIARLYQLEKQFADQTAQQRGRLRREHARPVLEEFRSWLDGEGVRGVLPKSATGKALTYTRNQWEALGRYTEDGELAIDNNLAERTVKIPALGRKNWRAPDVLSRTSGRLEGSGCLVGNVQRTAAVWSAVCI